MISTGDCVEVMAAMDAESVDAVVTDPPYGLGFMGKAWDSPEGNGSWTEAGGPLGIDHKLTTDRSGSMKAGKYDRSTAASHAYQAWCELWATEAYRLLKPGGHLLAFGGTRTYHRLASAIEDAGFEIRDCLVWAYASGFPKSHNLNGDWQGWGTALKPAWEPIVMARKPLIGTVAANVAAHGTGALNIDGTRIGLTPDENAGQLAARSGGTRGFREEYVGGTSDGPLMAGWENGKGRWPANVILTDPLFDGGVDGVVGGGDTGRMPNTYVRADGSSHGGMFYNRPEHDADGTLGYGDTGTYSRFFLIPKADRADREPVLRGQLAEAKREGQYGSIQDGRPHTTEGYEYHRNARENLHPTVKPVELMRHLVRLVTPPGGTVLDCFLGSGTTAIAAELEGFAWIGIEKEPEYVAIAEARLNGTQRGFSW